MDKFSHTHHNPSSAILYDNDRELAQAIGSNLASNENQELIQKTREKRYHLCHKMLKSINSKYNLLGGDFKRLYANLVEIRKVNMTLFESAKSRVAEELNSINERTNNQHNKFLRNYESFLGYRQQQLQQIEQSQSLLSRTTKSLEQLRRLELQFSQQIKTLHQLLIDCQTDSSHVIQNQTLFEQLNQSVNSLHDQIESINQQLSEQLLIQHELNQKLTTLQTHYENVNSENVKKHGHLLALKNETLKNLAVCQVEFILGEHKDPFLGTVTICKRLHDLFQTNNITGNTQQELFETHVNTFAKSTSTLQSQLLIITEALQHQNKNLQSELTTNDNCTKSLNEELLNLSNETQSVQTQIQTTSNNTNQIKQDLLTTQTINSHLNQLIQLAEVYHYTTNHNSQLNSKRETEQLAIHNMIETNRELYSTLINNETHLQADINKHIQNQHVVGQIREKLRQLCNSDIALPSIDVHFELRTTCDDLIHQYNANTLLLDQRKASDVQINNNIDAITQKIALQDNLIHVNQQQLDQLKSHPKLDNTFNDSTSKHTLNELLAQKDAKIERLQQIKQKFQEARTQTPQQQRERLSQLLKSYPNSMD